MHLINNMSAPNLMYFLCVQFNFRLLTNSKWMYQYRFIHATNTLLEVIKVPPFADSVSEGDVK